MGRFRVSMYPNEESQPPIAKGWRQRKNTMGTGNLDDLKAPSLRGQTIRGGGGLDRLIDPRLRGQRLGGRR